MKAITGAIGILAVLFTVPVAAQTPPAWSAIPYPVMGNGSAACTSLGAQGDVFCFGLRCAAEGNAPEWFTYQVGGDSAEGDVAVNLIVDGRSHSTLLMKQAETPAGEWSFSAAHDPARDRSAVELLRNGSSLYVLVGGASGAQLSLRGSTREIDRALSMCRPSGGFAEATPAAQRDVSYPEAFDPLILETVETCLAIGGKAQLLPDGVQSRDINGDGKPDYLVDLGYISCGTGLSPYCGAANCEFAVFASHGDGYISGRFLGIEPRFGEDAVLIPCPGGEGFSTIRAAGGELQQQYCKR